VIIVGGTAGYARELSMEQVHVPEQSAVEESVGA
jgi:hypothetical protein